MGTHPIFESDFDCLTENRKMLSLRFGCIRRIRHAEYLTVRQVRYQSQSTDQQAESQSENQSESKSADEEKARRLYNDKQARIYHAVMSNPVNKPYHSNKKLVQEARARKQPVYNEPTYKTLLDGTEVIEVKHNKTALQLAQEELEMENELKYFEVHDYKPKWYEFGGFLTNLNVDYAAEAERQKKWRRRLDITHGITVSFTLLFTVWLVGGLILKISTTHMVRDVDIGALQAMENKIARLEVALEMGKSWEPDFAKKQRELVDARAELVVMQQAEEVAKNTIVEDKPKTD